MLNAFLRGRSFLALSLVFFLLFSFSATYANEERDSGNLDAPLSLESDVALPEGLWPAGDNSAAEVPEEAPSMAVIPPPPLDPPPLKQLTLMLDWYLSPQHAALIVAKERALFAAQGLEIELLTPADPSIAIKLLAAGEVDLALTRQPLLHLHAHDGAPITRIATLIETPLNAVIVAGEAPAPAAVADALADLHYGYSTREGRDVLVEQLLPRSVRQVDDFVAPESVHFDAADALRSSRVDAVADGFFHTLPQQLASDGIVTHTVRYSDIDIPRHDGLILLANSDSVARQATTWSRVLIALEEASNWMIEHPEEAWTLLVTTHPVLDNPINQEAWDDLLRRVALSPAALDERRYAAFESYLQSAGVTENSIPITRLAANPHLLMER
ncbi:MULTISPECIES: ABC transporter substrate-binding protein [Halomonadaceae]|jgi:putative hydroxymethylpyrimidine transport system substrate-binding protein|uniref:ABC transporter ATP-binding protein n=1 Tax=Vreelandella aquamarina TaxID=77097 RepID=A0A0D7UYE0_9GAMM|nr:MULTISPECIES: ABC transporter substrate-binding protein [Halomonas]MEC9020676.1 ABC transporter substrate-binding protein [Pseudomonadota bacterium]KJD19571.1 ABC transporter substrate-binding protein [Halomonas meridiana]MCC4286705.1 ABC transporter substrate-binding protein [Halomonas meridiana]MCC4290260.1 ABC transporter substrate-binding protein [Halomonas axialensis]MCD1649840.1 ABC transporter substrate-binding protein [Halomonas axialensis]|tara:strand:+ start:279 stop:1436 length:1158 start_codon:yes stop_codon:yes gene_type:complete